MAGRWDSVAKRMIGAHPEHFVTWLLAEATFVAALDVELKSQHLFADALLKVIEEEKQGGSSCFRICCKSHGSTRRLDRASLKKGLEKGLEKGREEGLREGERQALLNYLQMRFPECVVLARQQTKQINNAEVLQAVSLKLFAAQTAEEARQILLAINLP